MKIIIKGMDGQSFILIVNPDDLILDIKMKISDRSGIPPE